MDAIQIKEVASEVIIKKRGILPGLLHFLQLPFAAVDTLLLSLSVHNFVFSACGTTEVKLRVESRWLHKLLQIH